MTRRDERLSVRLTGGGPWGFRLQGGAGTGLPLMVSKVRRKSKAYHKLLEGDRILAVNGRSTDGLTYDQLMDIADKGSSDLTLEVLRNESDKENQAPRQESSVKTTENMPSTKELTSFTETSTKTCEEKEGLRIKSATVVQESKPFEAFSSSKLEEKVQIKAVDPFPSFKDLKSESTSDTSTQPAKQDSKTTKYETFEKTETSSVKSDTESLSSKSPLPDITMDTIDLNNLISETQKRLDSFRNGYTKNDTIEVRKETSKTVSETADRSKVKSETSLKKESTNVSATNRELQVEKSKETEISKKMDPVNTATPPKANIQPSLDVLKDIQPTVDVLKDIQPTVDVLKDIQPASDTQTAIDALKDIQPSLDAFTDCLKEMETNDPAKKAPPTLSKLKTQPSLEAFKDCLKEMETDPAFSLPDIGFTSQSSEISTITTDIPFGTITKKKKMFSSSSFYDEPDAIYPTLEEQVEMAKKIAESLADDTNKKSKGANMFYKRVKRSSKWIHEGPDPSDESGPGTPEIQGIEPPTPDPSQVPFRPSKGPAKLKLVLDPRHAQDLNALRSSGYAISEHNVVSPEVCHDLVKDLQSPLGKGAALFAKRKKKSEEWVVDEEKVKALLREQKEKRYSAPPLSTSPAMNQYPSLGRQDIKLVKSPWEAAMESPYGFCDAAFGKVHPDHLADTVMRRADYKRAESLSRESSRMEGCLSPTPVPPPLTQAAAFHDVYHAKAPKGWAGMSAPIDFSPHITGSSPLPSVSNVHPQQSQNGYQWSKKMVFQNFNAVPRLWRGTNVH